MWWSTLGGKVVFADINLASFNIDPAGIEALITPRTKAICRCTCLVLSAEMEAINAISHGAILWWWKMLLVVLVPRFRAGMWAPWGIWAASASTPAKRSPPVKGA